jgi:hypothetical protein
LITKFAPLPSGEGIFFTTLFFISLRRSNRNPSQYTRIAKNFLAIAYLTNQALYEKEKKSARSNEGTPAWSERMFYRQQVRRHALTPSRNASGAEA